MDTDTKRDLGGVLLGAIALLAGLVLQVSEARPVDVIGGALLFAGFLAIVVLGIRLGVRLART